MPPNDLGVEAALRDAPETTGYPAITPDFLTHLRTHRWDPQGLMRLGVPEALGRHIDQALEQARLCSSDPLCAEHTPGGGGPTKLHAAACHACLFAPETSCERGNKYLDRAVLVSTLGGTVTPFFGKS